MKYANSHLRQLCFQTTLGLLVAFVSDIARANDSKPIIDVTTQHLRLAIDGQSRVTAFTDLASKSNHARNEPLAYVQIGEQWHPSTSLSQNGDDFVLSFSDTDATVVIGIDVKPDYIVFTMKSFTGDHIGALTYVNLPLDIKAELDAPFVAAAMALDLYSKVDAHPMPVEEIKATTFPHLGSHRTSLAVLGCPPAGLRELMKTVVRDHPGVPNSPLGGPFALDAPETRGSYMMDTAGSIGVDTVDQWIHMANAVGINQLDWHCGQSLRFGDLRPKPENFPEGRKSVKETIDKLHTAGMTAGLHTYAFFMAKDSQWVTPVPDKRLAKKATFTLAEDIDAAATEVPVVESTANISAITGFFVRNSVTLHIDDELIVFAEVVSADGNAFVKCTRGAHGTTAAPHSRGAKVHQLKECFGLFVPDHETTLFEEVIQTTADVYNECGFDMIYLDAIDGSDVFNGWKDSWHYGGRFVWELYERLERPVIMEMSMFTHHMWYVRSRAGAWDRPTRGCKYLLDMHIIANRHYDKMFLPKHLGWWGVNNWSNFFAERMFTDDLEYLCGKCIAHDSSQSQLTGFDIRTFDQDHNAQRMGRIVHRYEELRLNNKVPAGIRARLAVLGDEFTLKMEGDAPVFRRVHYDKHKVQRIEPWSNAWTAKNPYSEQPVKIRIEALLGLKPYDHAENLVVAEFTAPDEFVPVGSQEGVTFQMRPVDTPVRISTTSGALIAESTHTPRDDTWSQHAKTFAPWLNMSERGFGVWVHGDGKGELVNLQIKCPEHISHGYKDHYIKVDFEGWRYYELIEHESYEIPEYNWPYCPRRSDWESTPWLMGHAYPTYFYPLQRDKIETLSLYVNNLPTGDKIACYLSPIKSIPVVNTVLKNPSVAINGQKITFPIELATASYLEMYSADDCKVYDGQGALLAEIKPEGTIPPLRPGANDVTFTCEGPEGASARANVTVISYGDVLK